MKKAVLIFSALAAVLFVSCSGLSSAVTEQKSDDITCTIDASSFSSLVGARAAAGTFTIALTMQNASDSTTIQSLTATCTAGGSCTVSFDPVTAGTKVVFSGTVTYNGTAIGTISSDGYTIVEGTNTVSLIITPSYAVSVSVDLSSYGVTGSGSIILTLKNNSDSTTQTKTVTGSLSTAQTVTFDTAIATGTSVTASGYVLYSSKEAYYFTDKTFTVSSATGTVSMSGVEAQSFTYNYSGSSYSGTIIYGLQGTQSAFSGITSPDYFATTVDHTGQISVLYCTGSGIGDSSTYSYALYTNGKLYTVSGITEAPVESMKLCKLTDDSYLLYFTTSTDDTSAKQLYALTAVNSVYYATSVYTTYKTITSLTALVINSTPYVFFGYVDSSTEPYVPELGLAMVSGTTPTMQWNTPVSLTDTAVFSRKVNITDMIISRSGELYLLLSDMDTDGFGYNGSYYFTARGAFIDAGNASSIAEQSSAPSLSLTAYGWRSSANGTSSYTINNAAADVNLYMSQSSAYTADSGSDYDCYFVQPQRFLALTPKQITMADSGVYFYYQYQGGMAKKASAVFSLSGESLSFESVDDDEFSYGAGGSLLSCESGY